MTTARVLAPARTRDFWFRASIVLVLIVVFAWSRWHVAGRGDPDPGHRRINAIRPVLTAVPAGAHIEIRDVNNPNWDSCDGKDPGWNDATVDVSFTSSLPAEAVITQVSSSLAALGWTLDPGETANNPTYWSKQIDGSRGSVQFLVGGPGSDPPDWSLKASVPPATHPLPCI